MYLFVATILLAASMVSCSGQDFGFLQPTPEDLCKCLPVEPDILIIDMPPSMSRYRTSLRRKSR